MVKHLKLIIYPSTSTKNLCWFKRPHIFLVSDNFENVKDILDQGLKTPHHFFIFSHFLCFISLYNHEFTTICLDLVDFERKKNYVCIKANIKNY